MIICSSLCANYIPKAIVLAESIKRLDPKSTTCFCLVEKEFPQDLPQNSAVDFWVLSKDLGFKNFGRYIVSHNVMEGSTAIKGMLFKYLFTRFPQKQNFVYLDPDIVVYSDFEELRRILSQHEIVLTPHLVSPADYYLELSLLNHGTYNLGFLGLRRSANAESFVAWWCDRLDYACYDDMPHGIFTDQKWIDLVPAFFGAYLLRDPGYNVATWTMFNRTITQKGDMLLANGQPVRFIHFSGFEKNTYFWAIDRWAKTDKALLTILGKQYEKILKEHKQETFGNRKWSYDYLDNGEKITPQLRYAFRQKNFLPMVDPYILSVREIKKNLLPEQRLGFQVLTMAKKAIRGFRQVISGKRVIVF